MSPESRSLLESALKLSEDERFDLAHQLLESLPDDGAPLSLDDPNLVTELDRRWQARERAVSWDELQAQP
jgi:putative addiction module component (TIGR02574 family)